jgi:hypothetical protein
MELDLQQSREPKPSLEVRPDSIESSGLAFDDIATLALQKLASARPQLKCTLYVWGSMSVNFHEQAWSEFLVGVGTERDTISVLETLRTGFMKVSADAKCRMSDYIKPSEGRPIFHIEGGMVWQPADAVSWFTRSDEALPQTEASSPIGVSGVLSGQEDASRSHVKDVALRRSVRSDASIGTVKRQIEHLFGLPEGSVALCGPDRKQLRSDALIGTLRARWQ